MRHRTGPLRLVGRAGVAQRRLVDRLSAPEVPHPEVAAAVLVARGRLRLDQPGFAAVAGLPVEHVRSLESGRRPGAHVPHRLAALDATVDWSSAGVLDPADPADPAARHPSGRCR